MKTMRKSDEAVEKVLAGLGRIEVPDGLERRVLTGVQDRVERRARSRWRRRGMVPALVCGLMLAVAGAVGVRHRLEGGKALTRPDVADALPMRGLQQDVPTVIPARSETRGRSAPKKVRHDPGVRTEDAVALAEMRAPSEVAPPLPLTEQEKLLLRIVHKGDPEELALLKPEMRLRQEAEGDAEFQRFFSPSTATDNQKP